MLVDDYLDPNFLTRRTQVFAMEGPCITSRVSCYWMLPPPPTPSRSRLVACRPRAPLQRCRLVCPAGSLCRRPPQFIVRLLLLLPFQVMDALFAAATASPRSPGHQSGRKVSQLVSALQTACCSRSRRQPPRPQLPPQPPRRRQRARRLRPPRRGPTPAWAGCPSPSSA